VICGDGKVISKTIPLSMKNFSSNICHWRTGNCGELFSSGLRRPLGLTGELKCVWRVSLFVLKVKRFLSKSMG
jgi:hypothetical protein